VGRTRPVDAFIEVTTALLDHGVGEEHLRRMLVDNPTHLLNLD
jgi:predicted metal-dependent phosphotriesterase family hydrolase